MPQTDPLREIYNSQGPFSAVINPSQPAFQAPAPATGWESKSGQIGNLATSFLAGFSKSRANNYAKQEQKKMQSVSSINNALEAVKSSNATDEVKNQQTQALLKLQGELVRDALSDQGSTKGGKGGGQTEGQDGQGHPASHMLPMIKNMLDSMLGPAPKGKKQLASDESTIKGTLADVYSSILDPKNSSKVQQQNIDQSVNTAYAAAVEKNGGKPLTFAEIMAHPELKSAIDKGVAANGGKPTEGIAGLLQSSQGLEKEKQQSAIEQMKEDAAGKKETAAETARITAQKEREDAENKRQDARLKSEDQRAHDREKSEDRRANQREAHADARAKLREGGGGASDAKEIARGIKDGSLPPDLTRLYGKAAGVEAQLHKEGFNLAKAQQDWHAVSRHLATLNGPQQTRIVESANALQEMLPAIGDAYDAWQKTGLPGEFKVYNKAALIAAANLPGEKGKAAQNLMTYITDAVSETGQIYMGGNSPTDHALKMAQTNLQGDWNPETFKSSLDILQKNLAIRRNSILNAPVLGTNEGSPYVPENMRDASGQPPTAPQAPGAPPTRPGPPQAQAGGPPSGNGKRPSLDDIFKKQ